MTANLYLHPDTFIYNKVDSKELIVGKLQALVDDMTKVVYEHGSENKFKVPLSLASVLVYDGMTIIDLAEECLEPDGKGVFYTMIGDTSEEYDNVTLEELHEKCRYRDDEQEVNSILVFNVPDEDLSNEQKAKTEEEAKLFHQTIINDYITFDKYEVVYSKQTWLHLRRQILGNHPVSPASFLVECKKYFPSLCFHDNCSSSLVDSYFNYLETSPRKLVYYLSCLNDKFCEVCDEHKLKGSDANTILEDFSGRYGFDEPGSLQQNPEKKPLLTYSFLKNDKSRCDVVCEPHLKISQEDKNSKVKNIDYSKFHPRIYFYFADPNIEDGKILIGSMGKHI